MSQIQPKKNIHTQHFEYTYLQAHVFIRTRFHTRIHWRKWFIVIWHFKYNIPVGNMKLLHTAWNSVAKCAFFLFFFKCFQQALWLSSFSFLPSRLRIFFLFFSQRSHFSFYLMYVVSVFKTVFCHSFFMGYRGGGAANRMNNIKVICRACCHTFQIYI